MLNSLFPDQISPPLQRSLSYSILVFDSLLTLQAVKHPTHQATKRSRLLLELSLCACTTPARPLRIAIDSFNGVVSDPRS